METITITRDDFKKAVSNAAVKTSEEVSEKQSSPMASFLIPMTGMIFAKEVEAALFGDDKEPKEEEPKQEGTENGEE